MESPAWIAAIKDNLALIATALATLFIALRIFSVAAYNPQTAYGILQAQGTGTVIIGSLLSLVGLLPLFLTPLVLAAYDTIPAKMKDTYRTAYVGLLILLLLIAVFITPLLGVLVIIYVLALEAYLMVSRQRGEKVIQAARRQRSPEQQFEIDRRTRELGLKIRKRRRGLSLGMVVTIVFTLFQATVGAVPWLPPTELTVKAGRPVLGWVLAESHSFTTVLRNSGQISYISTGLITGKRICTFLPYDRLGKTIPEIVAPITYPKCSSLSPRH